MTFTEALSAIFDDSQRVTRAHGNNRRVYLEREAEDQRRLLISWDSVKGVPDEQMHPWVLTEQDYFAEDWEVVGID